MYLKYINYNGQMEVEIIFIYLVFLMFEFVDFKMDGLYDS